MNTLLVSNSSESPFEEVNSGIPSAKTNCENEGNESVSEERDSLNAEDDKNLHIAVFTTATLPWMTGTAVNPLFRAAFLGKVGKWKVTLVVPWLSRSHQILVYPNQITFESPAEQENYILKWLEERVGFKLNFTLIFYPAKFSEDKRSIFAVGDITDLVADKDAHIAVLEEPEHLNWFHHGKRWTKKFQHVIGIIHTNYLEYVKREKYGAVMAFLLKHVNTWVTNIHCNIVIRLSGATQNFPNSIVCNVNGVNPRFLDVGRSIATQSNEESHYFSKGAYYIGKMLWSKGYKELLDLLYMHRNELGDFQIDAYGSGEDSNDIKEAAKHLNLNIRFNQAIDHFHESMHSYKVLINPSLSDVLCTTTAEALAMGKFVVCVDHPSNEFFKSFSNYLTYSDSSEFLVKVRQAISMEPKPLPVEEQHTLSWEAATERFISCSQMGSVPVKDTDDSHWKSHISLPVTLRKFKQYVDDGFAHAHFVASGKESIRVAAGAIPCSLEPDEDQRRDLGLGLHSSKQPVYGWIFSRVKCCVKKHKEV